MVECILKLYRNTENVFYLETRVRVGRTRNNEWIRMSGIETQKKMFSNPLLNNLLIAQKERFLQRDLNETVA